MAINDNSFQIDKYKGPVDPCPLCYNKSPNAALDALMSGKSCRLCFGKGFIAQCLNCHSTGQHTAGSVWDGGRSSHTSVCAPCGGTGVFPAPKPAGWDNGDGNVNGNSGKDRYDATVTARNAAPCVCSHDFATHANPKRDPKDLGLWVAGRCKGKIGASICPCEEFVTPRTDNANVVEPVAVTV